MPRFMRTHLSHFLKTMAGLLDEQSPAAVTQTLKRGFNSERSRLSRLEDKVDSVVVKLASTDTKVNILMSIALTVATAYIYSLFK